VSPHPWLFRSEYQQHRRRAAVRALSPQAGSVSHGLTGTEVRDPMAQVAVPTTRPRWRSFGLLVGVDAVEDPLPYLDKDEVGDDHASQRGEETPAAAGTQGCSEDTASDAGLPGHCSNQGRRGRPGSLTDFVGGLGRRGGDVQPGAASSWSGPVRATVVNAGAVRALWGWDGAFRCLDGCALPRVGCTSPLTSQERHALAVFGERRNQIRKLKAAA
jgi:hypothetical protein